MKTYGMTVGSEPISDELVERLAKQAEDGYDVEQTLRRRGRPRSASDPARQAFRLNKPSS